MSTKTGDFGDFICDDCGKRYPKAQGLAMHRYRTHTPVDKAHLNGEPKKKRGRPPGVKNNPREVLPDADVMFERLGAATEALFPNGFPMSRIIEIAEWQKATLKILARGEKL